MTELKPEFKEKLLKAKVLNRWKKNFNKCYPERKKDYGSLNDYEQFNKFICASFIWIDTPEGHDFWLNVSTL